MDEKNETPGALKIPTNAWVGRLIDYSDSGASLLRRGKRQPTLALIRHVAEAIGWDTLEQIRATEEGTWARRFEIQVRLMYTAELDAAAIEKGAQG